MAITGRFNFRKTFTGKLVLQVETERPRWWPFGRRTPGAAPDQAKGHVWRDATQADLSAVELQSLLNLRKNPGYTPRSPVVFMMNPAQKAEAARSESARIEAAKAEAARSEPPTAEVVALASHRASG
ncbi:MAG: hypothetical protein PGN34_02055 [Methylobacterium frigidaeris]